MPESPGFQGRFVLALSLPQLITWGSVFYTFALLVQPVEADLGLDRSDSSLAFSLALLCEGLMGWCIGRWIERGHERRVMGLGSLWVGACLISHLWVTQAWGFYLLWAGLGLGMSATLYSPAFAVLTRRFPHDYRRAIITLTFLGGLASTVFIPLTAWLIAALGWRQAMAVLGVLQWLVCLPLHAWCLRGAAPAAPRPLAATPPAPTGALVRSSAFAMVTLFVVLMMGVTTALPAHLIPLLNERGLPASWVIAVPALIGVLQVLGRLLLWGTEQRLDVDQANRWIPTLIPLGLALLWLAPSQVAWLLLFAALYGMGNGMLTIVKGTAVARYVSHPQAPSLNGLMALPTAVVRALAPWLLGLMWSPQRGYGLGLGVLTALSALALVAMAWAQKHRLTGH